MSADDVSFDNLSFGDLSIEGQPIVDLATGLVPIVALSFRADEAASGVDGSRPEGISVLLRTAADARLLWRWSCELKGAAAMIEVPAGVFLNNDLIHEMIGIIDEFELAPGELVVRVTDTDRLANPDEALGALAALDDLGVDVIIGAEGTALAREFASLDLVDDIQTEADLDQAIDGGATLGQGLWLGRPTPLQQLQSVAAWAQWRSGPSLGPDTGS